MSEETKWELMVMKHPSGELASRFLISESCVRNTQTTFKTTVCIQRHPGSGRLKKTTTNGSSLTK